MPRAYTVPQYLTASVAGAGAFANRRNINSTAAGTTDDITTTHPAPSALALSQGYLTPGGASVAGAVLPVGSSASRGWTTGGSNSTPAPITAGVDGYTVEAGTWVFPISYKRVGGVLTADVVNATFTAILFKINTAGVGLQEIGRASVTVPTITTAKAGSLINIPASELVIGPAGENRWQVEVHVSVPAALSSDSIQFITNSTTGSRFTFIPPFTSQFRRVQSDAPVVTDTMQRAVALARSQSDAIAVTDPSFTRVLALSRARSDSITLADPAFVRRLDLVRSLGDSAAIADPQILRQASFTRAQNDSVGVADSMQRQISLTRILRDDIALGGVTEPYPDGLLRRNVATGRIESLRAAPGPLPSGALRRIVSLP